MEDINNEDRIDDFETERLLVSTDDKRPLDLSDLIEYKISKKEDNKEIGYINLYKYPADEIAIAYEVEDESEKGKGYIPEVLNAMTERLINLNKMPRLNIEDSNNSSVRVVEKVEYCLVEEGDDWNLGFGGYVPKGLASNIETKKLVRVKENAQEKGNEK